MARRRTRSSELCPILNISDDIRYPVLGAHLPAAGRHRQARLRRLGLRPRAPTTLGVDLIQNCEVTGFLIDGDRVAGVETTRGADRRRPVALPPPGTALCWPTWPGFRLPVQSHPLQALVSELHEPVHPTVVMSNRVHVYVSQAHKGELVMGAGVDAYNGYGQRGSFHVIEHQMAAAVELFPIFARAHVLRTWGGIVDVSPTPRRSSGRTPVENLYVNCGWGTGGFKATPGSAGASPHTIATRRAAPAASRRSRSTGSPAAP